MSRLGRVSIRVISLVGSPRREAMARQLDAAGLDWSFFDALIEPPDGLPYDPKAARRRHGRTLTPGELGCFASHVALWRTIADGGAGDVLLVLEDDLLLDPVFFSRMDEAVAAFAPYDYLRLYAKVPAGVCREAAFLNRHIARYSGRAYGTQGYFLSSRGAMKFLKSIKRVVRPIDDEMDRFWAHGLPIRSVFPAPIIEVDHGSTIEVTRRELGSLSLLENIHWVISKSIEKIRRHLAWVLR